MARFKVNMPCRWEMLLISLWIQVSFVPVIQSKDGPVHQLSSQDVLLLKDEQDPKCFTRAGSDFTCFFETVDNNTYDLIYKVDGSGNRCDLTVQRTEEGTLLHVCSFPSTDVYLYVEMHLDVVELNTNTSLYSRTLCVEDHFLLDPPDNVALHQTGRAGQLLVSWHTKVPTYCEDTVYRIQYSSKGVGERTKETKKDKYDREILNLLEPGEETDVQVTVKCVSGPSSGHWSSWTEPMKAIVPQVAGDISLICYTSDLQNITCQWNGSRYEVEQDYKLYYKIGLSEEWSECLADGEVTDLCCFHGDESSIIRVKLSSSLAPLSRTFYTEEFTLHTTLKTPPPGQLRAALAKGKLCLNWEAPLPSLSSHLEYEVGYRTREEEAWMLVSLQEAETGICLQVPTGSQYKVKIRAKPNGSVYSGYWSDWSDVLTGHISTDTGMLLMLCIPVSVLFTTVLLISTYLSKLKQYFWPPVPNLDKVLQGFLTELDRDRWDPPLTVKQWSEETTASVVEIISEDGVSELSELSQDHAQLPSPEGALSSGEQVERSPRTKVFPEYVTLNKDSAIVCPNRNLYEEVGEHLQSCQCSSTDGFVCVPPCSGNDFYNYSYMSLAEAAGRFHCKVSPAGDPGNLYTNLPCS